MSKTNNGANLGFEEKLRANAKHPSIGIACTCHAWGAARKERENTRTSPGRHLGAEAVEDDGEPPSRRRWRG